MPAAEKNTPLDHDVARYLATGESDPWAQTYPSTDLFERLTGYKAHQRLTLLKGIGRREKGHQLPSPPDLDLPGFPGTELSPWSPAYSRPPSARSS